MPNWCSNVIAFYQEDGGNYLLAAFYADIQKFNDYKNADGNSSEWIGHWLQSNKVDTEEMYSRGYFTDCELFDDHVRVYMETAWSPIPEVWDVMAGKYGLRYVYVAEECGCEVYVNTDIYGRFFTERYIINCFDVCDLELPADVEAEYGDRLKEVGEETGYFDSFGDVMDTFKVFGVRAKNIEELNEFLQRFKIRVHEYRAETE
jgi:hypothetical protein